ncbi:hypothetical protein ON010_g3600 [Phytophthora cinnamomi]|nr:hypothetical protein ON010_g3600 [Phytophthora cinnamomi]
MKAKLWDQAVRDFSEILRSRPDDVHGRFSRGMAFFQSGRVDDAHRDFSRVLELSPNHVMARYARAGCYNSEGEFYQAIQEYTLALQHDEMESAGGFRAEKRRMDMHESAEHLIRKTLGVSAAGRLRNAACSRSRDLPQSIEGRASFSGFENAPSHSQQQQQPPPPPPPPQQPSDAQPPLDLRPRSESVPGKRPRKVVQVRVNLSEFAPAVPQVGGGAFTSSPPQQIVSNSPACAAVPNISLFEVPDNGRNSSQLQEQTLAPRVLTVRAVPKTVRRVTVAL